MFEMGRESELGTVESWVRTIFRAFRCPVGSCERKKWDEQKHRKPRCARKAEGQSCEIMLCTRGRESLHHAGSKCGPIWQWWLRGSPILSPGWVEKRLTIDTFFSDWNWHRACGRIAHRMHRMLAASSSAPGGSRACESAIRVHFHAREQKCRACPRTRIFCKLLLHFFYIQNRTLVKLIRQRPMRIWNKIFCYSNQLLHHSSFKQSK